MKVSFPGLASAVAACLLSVSAQAYSSGISGRSGKQGVTCMSGCHGANAPAPSAPTVELSGPTSLAAGSTGDYVLVIRGGPGVEAGMNVAAGGGDAALEPGPGLQLLNGELTHEAPRPFSTGEVRFDFRMRAPDSDGTVTLYGAGNSTNGNGSNSGDHAVARTLEVQVTGTDEEASGGCAAAGGPPLALLLVLLARVRRRA